MSAFGTRMPAKTRRIKGPKLPRRRSECVSALTTTKEHRAIRGEFDDGILKKSNDRLQSYCLLRPRLSHRGK